MAEAGVQDLRVIPFTRETADLEPEEFLRRLRSECSLRAVVAGWNYTFGRGGRGDAELLRREGEKHGFRVEIVPPVRTAAGEVISSTAIRRKLEQGDVEGAGEMLGCPYMISGPVVKGKQEGARLGFPTANIEAGARKQMPAYGVYACVLESGGKRWQAVANIGLQPTLPSGKVTVEAHVISESPELYGQRAALYLIRFLRAERRFASLEELTVQIGRDRQEAREALEQADLTIFCLSGTGN